MYVAAVTYQAPQIKYWRNIIIDSLILFTIKDLFTNNVKLKKKYLNIVSIGRLTDQKDHITILKAIQNLIQKKIRVRLLIIGRGEEKGNLLKYIFENKLTKFVKLKNFLENLLNYTSLVFH